MKAFIFDFDGTLVDSVYAHTLAWQEALAASGMSCPAWQIHRRIGLSGTLLVMAVAREHGLTLDDDEIKRLDKRHSKNFRALAPECPPLPGAVALLAHLKKAKIAHGIATSGKRNEIKGALKSLSLSSDAIIVDGNMVREVKPEPDLFLLCQKRLKVARADCLVVGDAVWDIHAARRSGILSVGLLSGGFGEQELYNAGAMRVYKDTRALHEGIEELGFE
jgi:HAD superfamily hydrolase (TIGR01549 family)